MICVKAVLCFTLTGFCQIWANALYINTKDSKCTRLEDCPHINDLVNTKKDSYGVTTLLILLHCPDYNRQIYVKCIDPVKVREFIERADQIPDYDNCGLENLKSKITGGNVTALEDYPWIALLRYQNGRGKTIYGCHGNLISSRYLLTAAHCVHPDQLRKKNYSNVTSAILGEYDVTSDRDCAGFDCVVNQTKEIFVESFEIHPEYNVSTYVNDIALIRLASEVEYTDFIKPICLPPIILISPYNESLWIAGWGNTDQNVMNTLKVKAIFELNKPDSCAASNVKMTPNQFCARSSNFAKTCPGDSGGPLMRRITSKDSERLFLVGVNSLGIDCTMFTRHFAIYTKVSPYVEWILSTIRK